MINWPSFMFNLSSCCYVVPKVRDDKSGLKPINSLNTVLPKGYLFEGLLY